MGSYDIRVVANTKEWDRSTGVTFKTKDLKMTAACASGCTEPSHLETFEYRMKIQLHVADHNHAEITIQIEQILPEDELPKAAVPGQERRAGSSPVGDHKAACRKRQKNRTPSHGTDRDDQGETSSSDLPHGGIRSSRKRPKKQGRHLLAQGKMRRAEIAKGALVLEKGNNEAEASEEEPPERLIPTPVKIVLFAIFLFVIFMRIINGG